MRRLVYTCVFGGYDRVYPPVESSPDTDYVLVSDDPAVSVEGWRTFYRPESAALPPKVANLHFRALIHRYLPAYDASLYVDGNVRLLGCVGELFEPFLTANVALGLCPHALRSSVEEEAHWCSSIGKISDPERATRELNRYRAEGFADDQGLYETTILLRNHRAPLLDSAMALWAELFAHFQTRDQLSLPFVLWRTGVGVMERPELTFRVENTFFARYPHIAAADVNPLYAHVNARSYDSSAYRAALALWHLYWDVRRAVRQPGGS